MKWRWYHWWMLELRGVDELIFRCPWFGIDISYGAADCWRHIYWWGFVFFWKQNTNIREGDLLFAKEYKFLFREYSHYRKVQFGGLPL